MMEDFKPIQEPLNKLREALEKYVQHNREYSLVKTKLDEAELWLTKCQPSQGLTSDSFTG